MLLGPVRSLRAVGLGWLQAPSGHVAVAFMTCVGLGALQAWNASVAGEALAVYQALAQVGACGCSGHIRPLLR